jgi:hypothetical protein
MVDLSIYAMYKKCKLWSSWKCQWEAGPDKAFRAIIYEKERMKGISGMDYYRKEFREAV